MRKHLLTAAVIAGSLLGSTAATADGTHGSTFKLTNDAGLELQVLVYNGNDNARIVPHKVYYIPKGKTRTAKCHGNGTGRCYVTIQPNGYSWLIYRGKIKKNSECSVTHPLVGDEIPEDSGYNHWPEGNNDMWC